MKTKKLYKVTYQHHATIWNTESPIRLGNEYILELRNEQIMVRDFFCNSPSQTSFSMITVNGTNQLIELLLSNGKKLLASPFEYPRPIDLETASGIQVPRITKSTEIDLDDALFKQASRKVIAGGLFLILLAGFLNWNELTPETKEDLIPKKFAKIILTKPTDQKHSDTSARKSQAPVKIIARAFQSRTVVKGMQRIFNGGLERYSVFTSGKSVSKLSDQMNRETSAQGVSLDAKTSGILGAIRSGNYQLGAPLGVAGQGSGRLEIGLNLKDAVVDEGLTKEEVAKVIHSHLNEIRFCYESAIMNEPSLSGKVMVGFKISSKGMVSTAEAEENTMQSQSVSGCLVLKLKNWKFPEPRGGVQVAVTYPFIFKSINR